MILKFANENRKVLTELCKTLTVVQRDVWYLAVWAGTVVNFIKKSSTIDHWQIHFVRMAFVAFSTLTPTCSFVKELSWQRKCCQLKSHTSDGFIFPHFHLYHHPHQHVIWFRVVFVFFNISVSLSLITLKTLDTIGNCQRPVFSFLHKITNLWKFVNSIGHRSCKEIMKETHPCVVQRASAGVF